MERDADGTLHIREEVSTAARMPGTALGGLLGAVIGLLGGPLGVLLGGAAGLLFGSASDYAVRRLASCAEAAAVPPGGAGQTRVCPHLDLNLAGRHTC